MVRVTVVADTIDDAYAIADKLFEQNVQPVFDEDGLPRFKDRYANPTNLGYRDLMMNVALSNGAIAEVQISVPEMMEAKKAGHDLYKVHRSLPKDHPRQTVVKAQSTKHII